MTLIPIIVDCASRDLLTEQKTLIQYQQAWEKIVEIENKYPSLKRRRLSGAGGGSAAGGFFGAAAGAGTTGWAIMGGKALGVLGKGAAIGTMIGTGAVVGGVAGLVGGGVWGYTKTLAHEKVQTITAHKEQTQWRHENPNRNFCRYDHPACEYPDREYLFYYYRELAQECCMGNRRYGNYKSDEFEWKFFCKCANEKAGTTCQPCTY